MNPRQGTGVLTHAAVPPLAGPAEVRSVVAQIVAVQETIQGVLAGLTRLTAGTDEQVTRVARMLREVDGAQRRLAEAHQQTDDKLHALIAVVDGLVRGEQGPPR